MADENPTGRADRVTSIPESEDRKVQWAVLSFLLDEYTDHQLTIPEVSRAMNAGPADFAREDAVERAIRELVGAGLLLPVRIRPADPGCAHLLAPGGLTMNDSIEVARRFGANLRCIRRQADLSQEEVGFRSSLHRTEVGLLERGARVPRIDTLIKLAGALGVRIDCALLDGMTWTPGEREVPAGSFALSSSDSGGDA
jgi:DNA-binding XRE family transcriptional regulator